MPWQLQLNGIVQWANWDALSLSIALHFLLVHNHVDGGEQVDATPTSGILVTQLLSFSIDIMDAIERWKEAANTIGWEEKPSDSIPFLRTALIGSVGADWTSGSCQNPSHSLKILLLSAEHQQYFKTNQSGSKVLCQANSNVIWICGNNQNILWDNSFHQTHWIVDELLLHAERLREMILFLLLEFCS